MASVSRETLDNQHNYILELIVLAYQCPVRTNVFREPAAPSCETAMFPKVSNFIVEMTLNFLEDKIRSPDLKIRLFWGENDFGGFYESIRMQYEHLTHIFEK